MFAIGCVLEQKSGAVVVAENPSGIDNPVLSFFLAYWNAKRGARAMPSRADIHAHEIKEYLGWVTILDALPGLADFRYRLIGTRLTGHFHMDATGKTLVETYREIQADKSTTDAVLWVLRRTCTSRQPLRVTAGSATWRGRPNPDFDTLYLPLSEDGVLANMVLNVFTFNYAEFVKTKSAYALTRI